jgi:Tfp pilus assembly protein PilN
MPARKKESDINLLPEKGFATSTTGRVLAWILSTFRIIVIVTEILVMLAFLSRFWLDAQNSDLNEQIEIKKASLENNLQFENEFKDLQNRLAIYSGITGSGLELSQQIKQAVNHMPSDVFLKMISYQAGEFKIEGYSPSERSIQQYLANLQSINEFDDVSLIKLSSDSVNIGFVVFEATAKVN